MTKNTTAIEDTKFTKTNKHDYKLSEEKRKHAKNMLSAAKIRMMSNMKFYASMALGMQVKWCNIGTCGTDGKDLFVDPNFIVGYEPEYIEHQKEMYNVMEEIGAISKEEADKGRKGLEIWGKEKSVEEIIMVIVHEVRHCIDATMLRGENLDRKIMNQASDYVINGGLCYELTKGDIQKLFKDYPLSSQMLLNSKYYSIDSNGDGFKSWTTEAVYLDLLEQQQKKEQNGGGEGNGEGGEGNFDQHFEISEEQAQRIKQSMIQSASRLGKGDVPGDLQKMIDEWTSPKVKWQKYIDRSLKSQVVSDYTYQRPHSRSHATTQVMRHVGALGGSQSYVSPTLDVEDSTELTVVLDSSGSIWSSEEMLATIMSEIAGIVRQFSNCKLTLACFDTQLHNIQEFSSTNLNDIKTYQIQGGGGSDLTCLAEYLEKQGRPTKQLVVFTDLYISCDWEKLNKWTEKSLFVVYDNTEAAPIGKTLFPDKV